MGWWILRLTANILAFLLLTVNFLSLLLTDVLKINFHSFKKLKSNFYCCKHTKVLRPFWDKKVDFIIIVNCCNKLHLPFLYCGRKIYIHKITVFLITVKGRSNQSIQVHV